MSDADDKTERSGMKQDDNTVCWELLIEAAEELAWMHREYMSKSPLSEGVPRIIRLLRKIEVATGYVTASPYPP